MAGDADRPPTVSEDGSAADDQDYPEDLIVRANAKKPEQNMERVRRHTDVRREDWLEAERVVMEDVKRGRKAGP
jgi:hypothetical protein